MLDEADIQIIKNLIEESKKPPTPICGHSVLQDTRCMLPFTHTGLHKDRDGIWRCPWCRNDAFQNHAEDCPAKGYV